MQTSVMERHQKRTVSWVVLPECLLENVGRGSDQTRVFSFFCFVFFFELWTRLQLVQAFVLVIHALVYNKVDI